MATFKYPPDGGGSGGSTPPGGVSGQIQYNNGGVFAGDTSTTDGSGNIHLTTLTATGNVLAANISGQNNGDSSIVFRPGGVPGGVVYTDWADLYAAIVVLDIASVDVCFDNSLQPISIPAGRYNLINVMFSGPIGIAPSDPIVIELEDGCIFTNFPILSNLVTLTSISTTPVFTITSDYLIFLENAASLNSTTGAPLISVSAGATLFLAMQDLCSISGSVGFPLIDLLGNAHVSIFTGSGVNIGGDFLRGGVSSSVLYKIENPSISLNTSQPLFLGNSTTEYASNITNMTTGNGLGDLTYSAASGQGTLLSADTSNTKKFLSEKSLLGSPQAPIWTTIASSDLPPSPSSAVTLVSNNASYFPVLVNASATGNYPLDVGSGISFNSSTNKLSTTSLNLSSLSASQAVVTDSSKNLASLIYSSTVTNSSLVSRDSNGNSGFNNSSISVDLVVSSGQTITMSAGNAGRQRITGSSTVTFKLPDATTLLNGWSFYFNNTSTQAVTIYQQDGITLVTTLVSGAVILMVCTSNATVQGSWAYSAYLSVGATSSSSGTSVPGTLSAQSSLISGALGGITGSVLLNGLTSGAVTIKAQDSGTSYNFNLPTTPGAAGSFLSSGGGGVAPMTWLSTPLPIASGGTGVTSVTTAPTASSFAGWDANSNLSAKNVIEGYTSTVTAAGTTTLVVGSNFQQYFTGITTQTVVLPVTSTLVLGQSFLIVNLSSGVVTVQSSGGNVIQAMAPATQILVTCILSSGTTAASWNTSYQSTAPASVPVAPTIQKFTSGTLYTTPTSPRKPLYLKVTVIGGGGGSVAGINTAGGGGASGGGSGGASIYYINNPATSYAYAVGAGGTVGNAGGTSNFNATAQATGGASGLITSGTNGASGGAGGVGSGGTINLTGNAGGSGCIAVAGTANGIGGNGGAGPSPFGGGGGLGGSNGVAGGVGGNHGGGAGGGAGGNTAGAAGGTGVVVVEEFYQ